MDNEKLITQFVQIVSIVGTEQVIEWNPDDKWSVSIWGIQFSNDYDSFQEFIEALKDAVGHKRVY